MCRSRRRWISTASASRTSHPNCRGCIARAAWRERSHTTRARSTSFTRIRSTSGRRGSRRAPRHERACRRSSRRAACSCATSSRKSRIVNTAWLRLIERRNFARAAAIHFTAQREWDDAKALAIPLPHPFVVPNGIDLLPRPNLPRDAHTLAYLGRINWKKRLDVIIDALPALPGVVFRIAGNDEEGLTPVLRALAERRGVADRVEFTGPLYGDAKFAFLARATLFVLPSLSENFGNVVVEAMMMETPVVVSPAVGLAEQLAFRGAGIVADDFSSAIDTALRDDALRAELGASGRAYVEEELTWPRVAAQMEEAYQRCCAR
jgi:glycosyltransferase involved in cell wall biosynthesis